MGYHEVIISHVDSPGQFYVQFLRFESAYDEFLNKLKVDLRDRGLPKHEQLLPIGSTALIYHAASYKVSEY